MKMSFISQIIDRHGVNITCVSKFEVRCIEGKEKDSDNENVYTPQGHRGGCQYFSTYIICLSDLRYRRKSQEQ